MTPGSDHECFVRPAGEARERGARLGPQLAGLDHETQLVTRKAVLALERDPAAGGVPPLV